MLKPLALAAFFFVQDSVFHTDVPVVLVPVTVTTAKGQYIDGLQQQDFVLLEDGQPQPVRLDTADVITAPIALVIVVQANEPAQAALLKIQKTGGLIAPLIAGERGSAAIIQANSEVEVAQEFTSDAGRITEAFRHLKRDKGMNARMLDGVVRGIKLLEARPAQERRVILMIGESRDRGSQAKIQDVTRLLQRAGVTLFSATYSVYATPFTTKATDLEPAHGGGNLIAIFTEMGRLGKNNAAELLSLQTGGRRLSFTTLAGLEKVIGRVGEELHSQYLLSYAPPLRAPGFHPLTVKVKDHPGAVIHARPGYWSGGITAPPSPAPAAPSSSGSSPSAPSPNGASHR